ncbi:MAG TPA: class I SAM-dependent methyltransferase [Thermoanaerobaculia bacterium]|nr:class I SAM-dependent methyltransferase [Thermoanaerobaculia bacterium]
MSAAEPPLGTGPAYRLWAATYDVENPLTTMDSLAIQFFSHDIAGKCLLDAACGTARRLVFPKGHAPKSVCGVDLVFDMLATGRRDPARPRTTAGGDLRALPFAAERFDVVWCRLAAGHLLKIAPLYREFARVLRKGGYAVVTDFHPDAIRRGHARAFRDASGATHVVEHVVHDVDAHEAAAREAGLTFDASGSLGVGVEVRPFYERAKKLDRYATDLGLPLLLALRFSK